MTTPKRVLAGAAGLIVSGVGLWIAFRGLAVRDVAQSLGSLRTPPLLLTLVPIAAGATLRALRWNLLANRRAFMASLESICVSSFLNAVLPLRAGDIVRPLYFARRTASPLPDAVAAALAERVLDLAALGSLAAIVLPAAVFAGAKPIVLAAGAAIAALALLGLTRLRGRIPFSGSARLARFSGFLSKTLESLAIVGSPARLGSALVLSLVMWVATALPFALGLSAAGAAVSPWDGVLVLVFVTFAIALPSSPAFIGTFHAGFVLGAGVLGIPASIALPAAIATHVLLQAPFVLAGAAIVALGGRTLLSNQEAGLAAGGDPGRLS